MEKEQLRPELTEPGGEVALLSVLRETCETSLQNGLLLLAVAISVPVQSRNAFTELRGVILDACFHHSTLELLCYNTSGSDDPDEQN